MEYKNIKNHFNNKAFSYDNEVSWRKDPRMLRWFKQSINKKGTNSCLDVGTGTGLIGGFLNDEKTQTYGVDFSSNMIAKASKRIDFTIKANVENLPFEEEKFDSAVLRQVLHYVDDDRCLKEVYRVLKRGAHFACAQIAAPNKDVCLWWKKIKNIVQPLRRRFYSFESLTDLIQKNHFKIISNQILTIQRKDSWRTFIANTENPKIAQKKVLNIVSTTSSDIKDSISLSYNSDYIKYDQFWLLILAAKY